jgi:hypothetical protein
MYGNAETSAKVVELFPKLTNAAVRFSAVTVIDHLSSTGNPAVAAKFQKMLDDAEAAKDQRKIAELAPLKTALYRLNARAQ